MKVILDDRILIMNMMCTWDRPSTIYDEIRFGKGTKDAFIIKINDLLVVYRDKGKRDRQWIDIKNAVSGNRHCVAVKGYKKLVAAPKTRKTD